MLPHRVHQRSRERIQPHSLPRWICWLCQWSIWGQRLGPWPWRRWKTLASGTVRGSGRARCPYQQGRDRVWWLGGLRFKSPPRPLHHLPARGALGNWLPCLPLPSSINENTTYHTSFLWRWSKITFLNILSSLPSQSFTMVLPLETRAALWSLLESKHLAWALALSGHSRNTRWVEDGGINSSNK